MGRWELISGLVAVLVNGSPEWSFRRRRRSRVLSLRLVLVNMYACFRSGVLPDDADIGVSDLWKPISRP